MEFVKKEDFGDEINNKNLSPFEMLLVVAEKASEKLKKSEIVAEKSNSKSKVEEGEVGIGIPMKESSNCLPFDLNKTPSICKQPRTPCKRRCSVLNVDILFPLKRIRVVPHPRKPTSPPPLLLLPPPPAQEPPADLPEEFRRKIEQVGGWNVEYVILKKIFQTDINDHNNRLTMPARKCSEGVRFDRQDVPVLVIEPNLDICMLNLTLWNNCYVLNGGWKDLVKRNPDIQVHQFFHIWTFRVPPSPANYKCGFALVNAAAAYH